MVLNGNEMAANIRMYCIRTCKLPLQDAMVYVVRTWKNTNGNNA
jgi:hypothetical protein